MGRFRPTNNDATLDWARPYGLESEYVKVVWTTTHAAQIEVDAAAGVLAGLAAVAWRGGSAAVQITRVSAAN
jgi:hypothetical protein